MTGAGRNPAVCFATRVLTHYRVPFHEQVRALLAQRGIDYRLIYSAPSEADSAKGDLAVVPWAEAIPALYPVGPRGPVWQPIAAAAGDCDLVILGQENRHLANYPLQLVRNRRRKVALFGHGRNFQARNPDSLAERWKRAWATRCDWWFAYTDETRRHIESLGFPPERITVFDNAIDTRAAREAAGSVSEAEAAAALRGLGLKGANLGVFVGGLYPDKRLDFLVAAADLVRGSVPDFELLVIGDGIERARLERLAAQREWLAVAGARFGREKTALMRAAKLFLMPGLVGLAVLDAAAAGLPVVTTAFPWHSPEIAYLEDGVNGAIVGEWQSAEAYAAAVAGLLRDDRHRAALSRAARALAETYTVERMAERFAAGVVAALV